MLFGREVDEMGSAVVLPSLSGAAGDLWSVKPENSVVALLLQLLQQQSWGTSFLSSDQLNWTNIVISGHSQVHASLSLSGCSDRTSLELGTLGLWTVLSRRLSATIRSV